MQTQCIECGVIFEMKRNDQLFCCTQHSNRNRQRSFHKTRAKALLTASSDLDQLKQDNERLQKENGALHNQIQYEQDRFENFKDTIKKHEDIVDKLEITIDRQKEELKEKDVIIGNRNNEVERLKLEMEKMKRNKNSTKTQHFTREHLQSTLNKELRKQFPNDPEIQDHIGAIRAFNASYINALVTP